MAAVAYSSSTARTLDDLLKRLGGVSAKRVRLNPAPGTATVKDLIRISATDDRLYELVDGTLLEKVMGYAAGILAAEIIFRMLAVVRPRRFGFVGAPDTAMRLMPKLVRAPDVSFISRARLPKGKIPRVPVADLVPDLAVEILSKGDRPSEIRRKLKEYFRARVRLVWVIDPRKETGEMYTNPKQAIPVPKGGAMDGGDVLPGFELKLADLFADIDEIAAEPAAKPGRNGKKK